MITCAYPFGASCRPRGFNSNTFLNSSNSFARLRKNSLPVSVVPALSPSVLDSKVAEGKRVQTSCSLIDFLLLVFLHVICTFLFSRSTLGISYGWSLYRLVRRDVKEYLGSITSRCSGKEPALLPRTHQTRDSGGNRA